MTDTRKVLQQALEALKESTYSLQVPYVSCQKGVATRCLCRSCVIERNDAAIEALREALAQQGEPVAYMSPDTGGLITRAAAVATPNLVTSFSVPLYAGAAPAAQHSCCQCESGGPRGACSRD